MNGRAHGTLLDRLRRGARSLYLTFRLLPPGIRDRAALGYVLAREADDIADDPSRPAAERVALLGERRRAIAAMGLDATLRETLGVILDGMQRETARGDACRDRAELEDHLYVAGGVVGRYLATLFHEARGVPRSIDDAVAYGCGLELVNCLRDRENDARRGFRYLPEGSDILALTREALERLERGWRYVETIPHAEARLKLACAWPGLIALDTLAAAWDRPGAKVRRMRVYRLVAETAAAWARGPRAFSRTFACRAAALRRRLAGP